MNKQQLKYNNIYLANEIKENKREMKQHAKSGNYFIAEYGNKERSNTPTWNEVLVKWGHLHTGAAWGLQSKLVQQSSEARAYNMINAFLKGRRFDSVEKYYYNKGIDYLIATLTKDLKAYSRYCGRKTKQDRAINQARILLGSYEYKGGKVYTKNGVPVASRVKRAVPHAEFDKWINDTHTSL